MELSLTIDSNDSILNKSDTVFVIKDLKIKGSSNVIKRGTVVKNIRLTDSNDAVEGRVDPAIIVLKTAFLKKS